MKELTLTNTTDKAIVDDKHIERLSKLRWYIIGDGGVGRNTTKTRTKQITAPDGQIWRFSKPYNYYTSLPNGVMQPAGIKYDHLDRHKLPNLESNFRVASDSQNKQNIGKKSGYNNPILRVCLFY